MKAFGNVPKSGMQFVGDLLNAMLSPFETGEGIIRIIAGYACQVTGEERKYRIYSDAMTQYFMERYGSMEKFIETLEKDPVGLAGDISIFFTAGAGVLKTLAKGGTVAARALPTGSTLARGAQTASGVAERTATAVGAAGNMVDPLYVPGKVAGKAAQALSRSPQTRNVGRLGTLFSRSRSMLRGAKNASGIGGTQKAIERGSENDME